MIRTTKNCPTKSPHRNRSRRAMRTSIEKSSIACGNGSIRRRRPRKGRRRQRFSVLPTTSSSKTRHLRISNSVRLNTRQVRSIRCRDHCRNENVKLEIERLKKELKQTKKAAGAAGKASVDAAQKDDDEADGKYIRVRSQATRCSLSISCTCTSDSAGHCRYIGSHGRADGRHATRQQEES